MLEKIRYWLWAEKMRRRVSARPALLYLWRCRKTLVYDPVFKKSGLVGVIQKHEEWVNEPTK